MKNVRPAELVTHDPPASTPHVTYTIGLDLGKTRDFTAVAVLEQSATGRVDSAGRSLYRYDVRSLQRSALGTAYPKIVSATAGLVGSEQLRPRREWFGPADGSP